VLSNLLPSSCFLQLKAESGAGRGVGVRYSIEVVGNFILIVGLIVYGSKLFAEYHSRGKWAKNVTGLLAGIGMICLAIAFALTKKNVEVLLKISDSGVSNLFLDVSSACCWRRWRLTGSLPTGNLCGFFANATSRRD